MSNGLISQAAVDIKAPSQTVWQALVEPAAIKEYFFGSTVVSDWHVGSPILWKGEWQGKPYEDKGTIVAFQPTHKLAYTHFSPLAGLPDRPENYHTVTIELSSEGSLTHVVLSQDNNANEDERAQSEKNWQGVLAGLKKFVEKA